MLAEVNYFGPRLALPMRFPVVESDLRIAVVAPPDMLNFDNPPTFDLVGRMATEQYSFSFSRHGQICSVTKLHPWGHMTIAERNDLLAAQKSAITENDAYRIATNWLDATSVDVKKLDRSCSMTVEHEFRWRNHIENGPKDYLPLFQVKWGSPLNPKVVVEIDGRTKELLQMQLGDNSIVKRTGWSLPPESHHWLSTISDADFLTFSVTQRSNLISAAISTNIIKPFGNNVTNRNVPSVSMPNTTNSPLEKKSPMLPLQEK
jgi:hypothetical protein